MVLELHRYRSQPHYVAAPPKARTLLTLSSCCICLLHDGGRIIAFTLFGTSWGVRELLPVARAHRYRLFVASNFCSRSIPDPPAMVKLFILRYLATPRCAFGVSLLRFEAILPSLHSVGHIR